MKKIFAIALVSALLPLPALAQYEADTENGVVSLAGREGFSIETKKGDFVFKPYLLVQASANYNWYDDEGLDPAYNQDNVANSGFSIPYAVLGFTGKAFEKVTFNLSINAAASGGALLQQAWFDVALKEQFAVRVGKFKIPFSHAYLTTLGETLLPVMPLSLTTSVILPYSCIGQEICHDLAHPSRNPHVRQRGISYPLVGPVHPAAPFHQPPVGECGCCDHCPGRKVSRMHAACTLSGRVCRYRGDAIPGSLFQEQPVPVPADGAPVAVPCIHECFRLVIPDSSHFAIPGKYMYEPAKMCKKPSPDAFPLTSPPVLCYGNDSSPAADSLAAVLS